MGEISCVILTVSDSCSTGSGKDSSGPYLLGSVEKTFAHSRVVLHLIPDDMDRIEKTLIHFADVLETDLIITTGGTGFTKRDVTPEATRKVINKEAAGISTAICMKSLQFTEMAMLSRGVCGVRKNTLILNFPGSLNAVKECYSIVEKILPHALDQIRGETCSIKSTHSKMQTTQSVIIKSPEIKNTTFACPHKAGKSDDITQVAYRSRESNYPMIEVDDAIALIQKAFVKINMSLETTSLDDCLYRTLCETVTAKEPYPPFPASTKDGYACRSEDGMGERLVLVEGVLAGDKRSACLLQPGECSRISTGAPVPPGANCVVQVEDTKLLHHSEDGTVEFKIEIMVRPSKGQDIRAVGSDIKLGERVLDAGTVIGAAEKGLLCTLGVKSVKVYAKQNIGILSTGNELQNPSDDVLRPGHIRDSNKSMLMALLGNFGKCVDLGIASDDVKSLKDILTNAFKECRVIVTSGGVSMGERDLLKHVLINHFHGEVMFGRVNMKPGKPTVFIKCGNGCFVFALPGNPVSAYVTSHLFVIPALKSLTQLQWKWPKINVELNADYPLDSRPEYARANFVLEDGKPLPIATLTGNQISSRLISAVNAPLLVQLPSSLKYGAVLPKGAVVPALIIGQF